MNDDERHEIDQAVADLEAEEADQQAARGYASPRLARAIARLHRPATSTGDATAAR